MKLYLFGFFNKKKNPKTILFVLGCQRSGTTMLLDSLKRDKNAKIYGEFSELSSCDKDYGIRLNPLPMVERQISNDKEKLIVLKPLVECQNALDLLSYFQDSKAIWMYRHYKDVVYSNLNKWGLDNGIKDLTPIINSEPRNWRSENLPEKIRKVVIDNFSDDMDPYAAAALFWYVRNSLYFELGLDKLNSAFLCNYDSIVNNPKYVIQFIYSVLNKKYPGDKLIKKITAGSVGKGKDIVISNKIVELCDNLFEKLEKSERNII